MDLSSGIYYTFQILIKLGFQSVFTKSQKPEPLFYSEDTQVININWRKNTTFPIILGGTFRYSLLFIGLRFKIKKED
jgi:hypothetical protein